MMAGEGGVFWGRFGIDGEHASAEFAVNRVRHRVSMGGHDVPEAVIRRRFRKSWENFQNIYKYLADSWIVFDTSGEFAKIIEQSGGKDGRQ
jgi:predicted ABC-type ATPase